MVVTQKLTKKHKKNVRQQYCLNTTQNAKKCENGFLLRIIRCQILDLKHLKLRKLQS